MTTNSSTSSSPPAASPFLHILPPARLGRSHKTLRSFSHASYASTAQIPQQRRRSKSKHYSLVVVTESRRRRILLGLKHRGFGVGFYNSFGGKLELSECPTTCAVRELEEETGIKVPHEVMKRRGVGLLRFTFEDDDEGEMIVYLFRLDVTCDPTEMTLVANANNGEGNGVVVAMDDDVTVLDEKSKKLKDGPFPIDPTVIRGCEEITPYWYDDWFTIPLHQMFADDSVWLTKLLLSSAEVDGVKLNGHFHFCEGGQEVNTVMHHYVDFSTNLGNGKGMTMMPMELNDDSGGKAEPIGEANSQGTKPCSKGLEQAENHCPEGLGGNKARGSEHETSSIPTAQAMSSPVHSSSKSASFTLEQRLFHAIHVTPNHSPSIKEFKECYAFLNAVRTQFARNSFDVVLDVAGGHGALAALFLITTSATEAVVIDPAVVGGGGVENAWKDYWKGKTLRYRHECLRTGLPDELTRYTTSHNKNNRDDDDNSEKKTVSAAEVVDKSRILVVACHACQHLSDEILHISSSYGVHVAVMPCCQRDTSPGTSWKSASKNMNLPIGPLLDVQLAGKMMNWTTGQTAGVRYDVRMKVIDSKITPQNRIIVCKALNVKDDDYYYYGREEVEMAHRRLESAYRRAHLNGKDETNKMVDRSRSVCHDPTSCSGREKWTFFGSICLRSMALGLGVGLSLSFLFRTRR